MTNTEYSLVRSKRKTIAIYILEDGSVEVRAPLKASKASIEKFISEKSDWILEHSVRRAEKFEEKQNFSLSFGDTVLYRGKSYPILPHNGSNAFFSGEAFMMPENIDINAIMPTMVKLYKILAKYHITQRVEYFANIMNCAPTAVKINSAKTRWGSCSGKDSLNFSWRVILAEDELIDYVVVHELAHTKEHNHSARFWAVVASVMPDHKELRERMKLLSDRLSRENWD